MGSAEEPDRTPATEGEEIRAIVPARAVLTELARGFLLVHESSREQAVRFASTFLKEQIGENAPPGGGAPPVTRARRSLGLYPRGAVDPSSASRPRGGA
jgi:hypothetical protein